MQEPTVREQWSKRVERWKDSGLSAKEFAAETGINAHSLSWWRWQLSKGDTAPKEPRRRRSRTAIAQPAASPAMKFIEMMAPVSLDKLEIVLPSTMRICVRPGFDAATLGRLLDVLERR